MAKRDVNTGISKSRSITCWLNKDLIIAETLKLFSNNEHEMKAQLIVFDVLFNL